jgi:hypothetical protein
MYTRKYLKPNETMLCREPDVADHQWRHAWSPGRGDLDAVVRQVGHPDDERRADAVVAVGPDDLSPKSNRPRDSFAGVTVT